MCTNSELRPAKSGGRPGKTLSERSGRLQSENLFPNVSRSSRQWAGFGCLPSWRLRDRAYKTMSSRIVIAGSIAQKPLRGGHTWVFLQYVLGFIKLGWDVLFLDRLEPDMCVDANGQPCPLEESVNLQYFVQTMNAFGLAGKYAVLCDSGTKSIGVSRQYVLEYVADSGLLFNIMGFLQDPEILNRASMRDSKFPDLAKSP